MKPPMRLIVAIVMLCGLTVASADMCLARGRKHSRKRAHHDSKQSSREANDSSPAESPLVGTQLRLTDRSAFAVDEAWEDAQGIWYRKDGVTQLLERSRVRSIERGSEVNKADSNAPSVPTVAPDPKSQPVWIYLVGGARVEADDAAESADGVWYRRGALSVFIEKARVERIEREIATVASGAEARAPRGWSTGSGKLDGFIKQSSVRHGVDPYLIFLVMEEESHFNPGVVSPKGARGLMQLMPGTGARFGVRNPFNPAQNIEGGTRYLKELLKRFNGRVDLVLASYNAGEGAVARFGVRVPPYRETQSYVRRISKRYGKPRVAQSSNQSARREGGQ
jgi:Zn-finger nucleic acid-binding protein